MLRGKIAMKHFDAANFTGSAKRIRIGDSPAPVVCELLEARRLLAEHTWIVPTATPPHTAVYIHEVPGTPGLIRVRLDSPTAPFVDPNPFTNATGMSVIQAPAGSSGFLFVDKVPAALKPLSDGQNDGIKVEGGSGGHLRIEAGPDDDLIRITESTATSATVEMNTGFNLGRSRFGSGVNQLTIQTHNNGGAQVRVATEEFSAQPDLPGLAPETSLRIESLGVGDNIHLGGADDASVHATVRTGAGFNKVILLQGSPPNGTTSAFVDFDPNLGGQLGDNSLLRIGFKPSGINCTATLTRVSGTDPHTITLDRVEIFNGAYIGSIAPGSTPATLYVQHQTRVGKHLWVSDDNPVTQVGSPPQAFINAPLTVANSSFTDGKLVPRGRVDFNADSAPSIVHEFTLVQPEFEQLQEDEEPGEGEGTPGVVNVNAGADVTVLTSSRMNTLNIVGTNAKLTLQPRPTPVTPNNARKLTVETLSMGSGSPSGKLDLKDNVLIIDYSGSSPIDYIDSLITSGYANAAWTGNGITSSTAAAIAANSSEPYKTGLGFAENVTGGSDGLNLTTFEGQSVDSTTVLIKYTFYGDANLSGEVGLPDFNRVAGNFGQSPRRWVHGDFNFDNTINLADFNRLAANFGRDGLGPGDGEYQGWDMTWDELMKLWEELTS